MASRLFDETAEEFFDRTVILRESDRELREREEARQLRALDPGRFPDWASPARMRRELRRNQEEDRYG